MAYSYSIPISQHLYEDVPLYKITISAQRTLNRVKKYAPYDTGNLQDSIQIKTDDLDHKKLTIYINTDAFVDWDNSSTPYYKYLDQDDDKHYQRGVFKGQKTKGWWERLCIAFTKLWNEKADKLESYQPKEDETNATASEHRKLAETNSLKKLKGAREVTIEETEQMVEDVTTQEIEDYRTTHKGLKETYKQRKGYAPAINIVGKVSIQDMQSLSAENIEYILSRELGIKLPQGYARSPKEYWKLKRLLLRVSKNYGEIKIGGLPVRAYIRELIRKLKNSEHINAR